jgi:DHA2 family multidrug resistance protein
MIATAMQAADATIVNVALPQLAGELGGGLELGAWVMTSYLCAAAIVAPLTGWLRRRFGPRMLYHGAVGIFVLASLLCALAPSAAAIIVFRIVQGAGGGVIPALAQAVLHDLHPRERHGRVLGIWGAAAMLGPVLGPALGGAVTDLASWRWVFIVNIPLGLLATWRMRRLLPSATTGEEAGFDVVGLLLLITAVGALQLSLQRGVGQSWLGSPELLGEISIAIVAFAVIAVRLRQTGFGILRLDVFRDWNFAAAAFLNFTTSGLVFTAIVFLPTLAQGPLGYPPTVAGLTIVPRGILMMLTVLALGQVIARIDYRIALAAGSGVMAIGLWLLTGVDSTADLLWIVAGSAVQSVGAGMILMPLSTYAFATLPVEMRTDAAGLYSLLRQIGCASSLALMSVILQARIASRLAPGGTVPLPLNDAMLAAYDDCFTIMAFGAVAIIPAILLFRAGGAQPAAGTMPAD